MGAAEGTRSEVVTQLVQLFNDYKFYVDFDLIYIYMHIASMCGHPVASEGCHLIANFCKKEMAKLGAGNHNQSINADPPTTPPRKWYPVHHEICYGISAVTDLFSETL